MGWEPREFTEYIYDGDRVAGTVTHREPEFTDEWRELVLAHLRIEQDRGPHGQPMSEATDADANPSKAGGWHYEANPSPRIDFAAKALTDAQEKFYAAHPKLSRAGHLWHVHRVDG